MTPQDDRQYASWKSSSGFQITYELSNFHEIDFLVNDSFRRIPYGGIEIGGLLFGSVANNSARIEAFRLIDCEHALGPSFTLSDRDVDNLRRQLKECKSDSELSGLEAIGWFISHSRSQLQMSDREQQLFAELFPGPGKITLLIKPERFQATRFGFLVRDQAGNTPRDAAQDAFILALPGRANKAGTSAPTPSIPAPPENNVTGRSDVEPLETPVSNPMPARTAAPPPAHPQPPSAPEPWQGIGKTPVTAAPEPPPLPEHRAHTTALAIKSKPRDKGEQRSSIRLAAVLIFAAALGCAVGYWAYLQLPSATIPLDVQPGTSSLLISWPPEQTRGTEYAAIRVDDGDPVPLSNEDKTTGETQIHPSSGDVKVELIAHHFMRDSRGIVRYLERPPQPAPSASATTPVPAGQNGATKPQNP